jgi:hypothetical protein
MKRHIQRAVFIRERSHYGNPFRDKVSDHRVFPILYCRRTAQNKLPDARGQGSVKQLTVIRAVLVRLNVRLPVPFAENSPHVVHANLKREYGGMNLLAIGLPALNELNRSVATDTAIQYSDA